LQESTDIVLTLPDAIALVRVPGAGLVNDALSAGELNDLAFAGNALAVHDLELGLTERGSDLVLHDLHAGHVSGHFLAILDGADASDVQAYRGVELQRVTAGGGLRATKHHTDLHADLVDENDDGVRALDVAGELTQRLRHQAR